MFPFVELPYDIRRMIYLLVVDEEVRSIPLRGSRLSVDTNYLSPFSSKRRVCQRPIDTLVLVNRQISSEAKEVYYNQKIFTATPTCYEPATHLRMISSVLIRNCSPLGLRLSKNVARRSAVQMLWRTDAHLVKEVELTMDLRSPLPYRPQHPTQVCLVLNMILTHGFSCSSYDTACLATACWRGRSMGNWKASRSRSPGSEDPILRQYHVGASGAKVASRLGVCSRTWCPTWSEASLLTSQMSRWNFW